MFWIKIWCEYHFHGLWSCAPLFHSTIEFLKSLFHLLNHSRSRLPLNNALSLLWRVTTTNPTRNTHAHNFICSLCCFVFTLQIAVVLDCYRGRVSYKKQKQSLFSSCCVVDMTPSYIRTTWDEPPYTLYINTVWCVCVVCTRLCLYASNGSFEEEKSNNNQKKE